MGNGLFLKECNECYGCEFEINEFIVHRATLSDSGEDLTSYKVKNYGIENIICRKCGAEYFENNFKQINF